METQKVIKWGNSKVVKTREYEFGTQVFLLSEKEYLELARGTK